MKSKKTLAILLAIMMILSSVPMFAFAAETLTTANIQTLPTVSMKNPDKTTYTYGTTYADIFEVADDEVVTDAAGNQVAGHFELRTPDRCPDTSVAVVKRVNLIFVPDDTTAYTSFNKNRVSVESYGVSIEKTTLKLVDEVNDPPVVEGTYPSGTPLSKVKITGGAVVNVFSDAANANEGIYPWQWQDSTLTVTESGYYNAVRNGLYYSNELVVPVYITVEGVKVYGAVTTWPTIECPEWTKGMTVADLTLKGGEATVEGTFAITTDATTLLKPNKENSITVKFTPADSEVEMTTATVNSIKITPTFTRKDITVVSISPVTIEYGKRLNQMSGTAKNYGVVTAPDNTSLTFNLQENKNAGVYDVALAPGNYTVKGYIYVPSEYISGVGTVTLYNPTTVDIPIVVTKKTSTAKFGSVGTQEIVQEDGSVTMSISYRYEPEDGKFGHAVLKVNGETVVDNITDTAATEYYSYNVRESGTYTATLEYVPAETDYIEFTETVLSKTVDITVDLVEEDPIIPILPGGDSDGDDSGITLPEIDLGDFELNADGDHKFKFVNIIQNLIEMLKNFIKQIGQTIEGIL